VTAATGGLPPVATNDAPWERRYERRAGLGNRQGAARLRRRDYYQRGMSAARPPIPPESSRASRPPSRFVFAALVATLGLAGVLGANVLITARYHRSVAEGVLRDYAGFAAGELENRVQTALAQRLFPMLSFLGPRRAGSRGLPSVEELGANMDSTVWRAVGRGITLVRQAPGGGPLETRGEPLGGATSELLADSLQARARALLSSQAYFTLFWLPGDPAGRVAVFTAARDGDAAGTVYGVLMPGSAIPTMLAPALGRYPLLPPSLTGGTRLDSAVSYRVRAPNGRAMVESGAVPATPFAAARRLDPMWGGLEVEVALREALAGRLLIGGLPRSRLPLVLALLALTTVLVATAAVQLGRERDLARLREEFVAAASHELRTPLAQIRLFTETLRLGRVRSETERERSLEIIEQETRRLAHLVENLLYGSRAGRGALVLTPETLDLAAVLRDAVEGFGPIAASRRATVAVAAPQRLQGRADADAFRQIVLNLLDNAVKYGPSGQTIQVALTAGDGRIRLTVDDQGPGIPAGERARIFERFVRLDRDREGRESGTGLGLALVSDLARLQGGRAWAEAAASGGARLVVELPAAPEG